MIESKSIMSVKAKLVIDELEINIINFSFGFNQGKDTNGKPTQKPMFIGLQLTIETQKNVDLADWAFAQNQTKQIELHIYPVILGGKTRKLFFYDCHLIGWKNEFWASGNQPMSETLFISAGGIEDSNSVGVYSAYWRTTYPPNDGEVTTLDEEEFAILSAHFEDENREQISELYNGIATLVLQTENGAGKVIDVDLSSAIHDFKYKGNILEDDILTNISLTADTVRIELEIIEEQND